MNRADLLTALNTTPDRLIALAVRYPGPWYCLQGSEEGDWQGQIAVPQQAHSMVISDWGRAAVEAMEHATVGMLTTDAILLLHAETLERAGLWNAETTSAVNALRDLINAVDDLRPDETLLLGYIPLFEMHPITGALTVIEDPQ